MISLLVITSVPRMVARHHAKVTCALQDGIQSLVWVSDSNHTVGALLESKRIHLCSSYAFAVGPVVRYSSLTHAVLFFLL